MSAIAAEPACPGGIDLRESMTVAVGSAPAFVHEAVRRIDLAAPLRRAVEALDAAERFALPPQRLGRGARNEPLLFGTIWRIDAAAPAERISPERFESFHSRGYVKAGWAVHVVASDGDVVLSVVSRFAATDDRSAARLLDAWSVIGRLSHALAERAARAVKAYAEELDDE